MELTNDFLSDTFDNFNQEYFKGVLVKPLLGISHRKNDFGYFLVKPNGETWIKISDYYKRDKKSLEKTMLHEMIHLFQYQFRLKDRKHGKDFTTLANYINKKGGWDISRLGYFDTDTVQRNRQAIHHMIAFKYYNGECFLFSSPKSQLRPWLMGLEKNDMVKSYFTFDTMDGKYDDFPACRKKCRGVIISDKMYQSISKEYDIIITEKWQQRKT